MATKAVYQYTVLCYNESEKSRTFGSFVKTRAAAEKRCELLAKTWPKCRFSVASVKVG